MVLTKSKGAIKIAAKRKVGFFKAVLLLFKNYDDFYGRASLSEYWWAIVFIAIFAMPLFGICFFFPFMTAMVAPPYLMLLAFLWITVSIRRLHDTGKDWKYILINLIPIIGTILFVFLMLCKSDGDNQWGDGPVGENEFHISDKELFSLAAKREPFTVYKKEDKAVMRDALIKLIPNYAENQNISASILLCDDRIFEENIRNSDADTLFIAYKALNYHLNTSNDSAILNPVKKRVSEQLKCILKNEINIINEGEQLCN